MNRKSLVNPITSVAAVLVLSASVQAATILYYDSETASDQLTRIASQTNAAFVTSSDTTTSVGSAVTVGSPQATQTNTVTLGGGTDKQYWFGTPANSSSAADSLAANIWLGTSFVAAQALTLDSVSLKYFANSANGSSYSARDVGLFVSINSGAFTQFGALRDSSNTGAQNSGNPITFTDTVAVASGQTVQLRLAFTDKTLAGSTNLQAATRVGSLDISAVPEPSTALLGAIGSLMLLRRR